MISMTRFLLSFVLIPLVVQVSAQHTIKGRVLDEQEQVVAYAHILVYEVNDFEPVLLLGEVTSENGLFSFLIYNAAPVYFEIQMLGYVNYTSDTFQLTQDIDFGDITLLPSSEQLEGVTVTGRKPLFEQRMDRTIVNVQGSVTNVGNTVLNILGKSPMVRVNRAGNEIAVMGKQGVVVMVDGKQMRLDAQDMMTLLSNMSSDNIEQIEIITSPPSSFDAQGNSGIINIKTIQPKDGFSGQASVNMAYGSRPKYGANLNLSYQKNKWYGYTNLSANIAHDYEEVFINTQSDQLATDSDLYSRRKPTTGLYNVETGLEYDISSKTTMGAMFSTLYSDWTMDSWSLTNAVVDAETSATKTTSYEENRLFRILSNFNLRHSFSEKTKLILDYDFIKFKRKNPTDYTAEDIEIGTTQNFRSNATTPVTVHVVKADLELKPSEKISMQYGLKGTFSDFENQVVVAYEENDVFVQDPEFTDDYYLSEGIYAMYTNIDYEVGPKLSMNAGLRYEYYDLDLSSKNGGTITTREQGYLFPSIYFTYSPRERLELSFSYTNRIQRPGFLILAPYFYFFDDKTLFTGNPTIVPSRSNQLQANLSINSMIVNLQYNWQKDPIIEQQPTLDATQELLLVKPIQGENNNALTLNLSHPLKIANWWQGSINVLGTRFHQQLNNYERPFLKTNYSLEANLSQNWMITDAIDMELSTSYSSPYYFGVMRMKTRYQVDLGLRKRFRSGASLSFNINDVFDTGTQWPSTSDLGQMGFGYGFNFDGEGPVFRLNYSMPIGNKNLKTRSKRKTGSDEIQNRLN